MDSYREHTKKIEWLTGIHIVKWARKFDAYFAFCGDIKVKTTESTRCQWLLQCDRCATLYLVRRTMFHLCFDRIGASDWHDSNCKCSEVPAINDLDLVLADLPEFNDETREYMIKFHLPCRTYQVDVLAKKLNELLAVPEFEEMSFPTWERMDVGRELFRGFYDKEV
jgi:hypothetical protein